jgi:Spy/CpxP family protein refolding chaperone
MSSKTALVIAASMLFTTVACDSAEDQVEDGAVEAPATDPADIRAERGHHGKRRNAADKLCAELECSEGQASEISELFARRHESRDSADHQARKAARAETNKVLADAFRADAFDPAVLDRAKPERDGSDHETKILAFATELHGLLTPEQRAKLGDKIEADGPMFLGGRGKHGKMGKHGKHGKYDKIEKHGKHGKMEKHGNMGKRGHKAKHDPAERLAHEVDRFCEPVSCTDEQRTRLTATFEGVHQTHRDARAERKADKPDFSGIADAFRAETLDEAKLRAHMAKAREQMHDRKADHRKAFGSVLAEVHDIVTPEQRAIIAQEIEADGLRALAADSARLGPTRASTRQ